MELPEQTNKNTDGSKKSNQPADNFPPTITEPITTTTTPPETNANQKTAGISANISVNETITPSESPTKKKLVYVAIIVVFLALLAIIFLFLRTPAPNSTLVNIQNSNQNIQQIQNQVISNLGKKEKFIQFTSEEDFKNYLEKAPQSPNYGFGIGGRNNMMLREENFSTPSMATKSSDMNISAPLMNQSAGAVSSESVPSRFSETNNQVLNIDEPDIVKNDGQQIYFSEPISAKEIMFREDNFTKSTSQIACLDCPNPYPVSDYHGKIQVIQAFPPENSQLKGKIDQEGEMLLKDNVLVVFSQNKQKVYGYDVSDPQNPQEKWQVEIKDKTRLISSRLYGDTIYLATESSFSPETPCPFHPLIVNGTETTIECTDIYHPEIPFQSNATYTLSSLDFKTGQQKENVTFVGSTGQSEIYMSQKGIYLTYAHQIDILPLINSFFSQNKDLVPASLVEKITKLINYDLSENAKYTELASLIEQHIRSLDKDETMRFNNEINNRLGKFMQERSRELTSTNIVKIAIPDLKILATGKVPGTPLNQFSLDEYQDNLRIATTSDGQTNLPGVSGIGMVRGQNNSVNDVYILDNNLNLTGSVKDLGKGEKIYSVRFIENKGYIVTFKQIDPFFVLDLTNPANPLLKGELKIPGYSSYLHPIDQNTLLGVGEESGKVKITLFDVTQPENPRELNTYSLDEYYSEVNNNHHAFLLDKEHQIFFLPGSQGAYIFSYADNQLSLKKTVSDFRTRRALYIDHYFYILSDQKMLILDENNWEKVKELEL